MSDSKDQSITFTAQCFCKAHSFTATVPASTLPLTANLCHCDSCRHVTGALYSCDTRWPNPAQELDVSGLSVYPFSKRYHLLFCGTCSTPMFFHFLNEGRYGVFTGALPNLPNLVRLGPNYFVHDTIDGGVSPWLRNPHPDGKPVKYFETNDAGGELSSDWPSIATPRFDATSGPDELPIRCHCKGIDLVVRRWDTAYKDTPQDKLPWYVDPQSHKYHASFDACDSCRSSFGMELVNFTFAPLSLISFAQKGTDSSSDETFPEDVSALTAAIKAKSDPRLGTLAFYKSSPDVTRYFCSRCSAAVFYGVNDRPEIVDIALGLLESPEGARAEGFLSWNFGAISYAEDNKGGWREDLINNVQKAAEAWRLERDYPKSWRRVIKEEAEAKAKAEEAK